MAKQFTTLPIAVRVVGGQDALSTAAETTISLSNNINRITLPAEIQEDGESLVAWLTPEQTGLLKGNCRVEATLVFPDGAVWKTRTAQMKINPAVSEV